MNVKSSISFFANTQQMKMIKEHIESTYKGSKVKLENKDLSISFDGDISVLSKMYEYINNIVEDDKSIKGK